MNTLSLVQKTIDIRNSKGKFDQVWCVFDLDDFPKQHFNDVIQLAEREKIKVAYSNEAFELWYVLHFDYLQATIGRKQYRERLTQLLGRKYLKSDATIYEQLYPMQETAIANAERLLGEHESHLNYSEKKPSTTVHLLVLELNKYVR